MHAVCFEMNSKSCPSSVLKEIGIGPGHPLGIHLRHGCDGLRQRISPQFLRHGCSIVLPVTAKRSSQEHERHSLFNGV